MTMRPEERAAMEEAARLAVSFRDGLATAPVPPVLQPDDIKDRFSGPLADAGHPADAVLSALATDAADGLQGFSSPRFFGYVVGGSMPVGIAADMLVSAWGQNSSMSRETPAIAAIEQSVCRWCLDLLGLPEDCGVGIVTGATLSNTQGVMAARHALLSRQGWDVEDQGLFGAPEFPVLIGADAHSAAIAALRYAGLGAGRVTRIATDTQGRVRPGALKTALDACTAPPLVVLQAGQINSGASDPFAEVIPLVQARGGWVHVDGAFGLWLNAVPGLRDLLAGVDQADSWAVDLHKWLNVPYDSALCIVRDRGALVHSMSARGAYLPAGSDVWEPSDSTLDLSRRARGVPAYAILRHLGAEGVRAMVTRHCTLAVRAAGRLAAEPGIDVLNDVVANQVAMACASDALTQAVLHRVQTRRHVYPSHGAWQDRQIIRISVCNYATTEADVDLLTDEIVAAKRALEQRPDTEDRGG